MTAWLNLHMQGLRLAFDHMIGSRFEEMVREADVAETLAAGGSPPPVGTKKSGGAVQTAEMTLLSRPAVFTLAIVWDSPQVGAAPGLLHVGLARHRIPTSMQHGSRASQIARDFPPSLFLFVHHLRTMCWCYYVVLLCPANIARAVLVHLMGVNTRVTVCWWRPGLSREVVGLRRLRVTRSSAWWTLWRLRLMWVACSRACLPGLPTPCAPSFATLVTTTRSVFLHFTTCACARLGY